MVKKILPKFFFIFLILVSCKSEQKQFELALQSNDLTMAQEFKTNFPESVYPIDSLIHELEYKILISANDIQEHIKFLKKYPKSFYQNEVQSRLYELEREHLGENWSIDAVNEYLINYPYSPFFSELEEWLFRNAISGKFIDKRDHEIYTWKKIGDQIWMTQNLRTVYYNDGANMQHFEDNKAWSRLETPAYCWYDNKSNAWLDKEEGALYNWYMVNTEEICPIGWHVPSEDEWYKLIENVKPLANDFRYYSDDGIRLTYGFDKALAAKTGWSIVESSGQNVIGANQEKNNISGFTGTARGMRLRSGRFVEKYYTGYWWSSTTYKDTRTYALYFSLGHNGYESTYDYLRFKEKQVGMSVRCIKD
jgi:uncharacterized protein (TIGR02145 family)